MSTLEGSELAQQTAQPELMAGYGRPPLDEAVTPDGAVRQVYVPVIEVLDRLGPAERANRVQLLNDLRNDQGLIFSAPVAGRLQEQVFPLDVVPRIIGVSTWQMLSRGPPSGPGALNAFLADIYADREPGRLADIVAEGIIPDRLVRGAPGFRPLATGLVPAEVPRATVYGIDLLTDEQGRWVVLEDNLQVPSGLAYALGNRRTASAAFPELADTVPDVLSPEPLGSMFIDALRAARPARCDRDEPQVVVLSDGPQNSAWYEHRMLAAEMGVPIVLPGEIVRDGDNIAARVGDEVLKVDVLYRRAGSDDLINDSDRGPGAMIRDALLAGTVSVANAPGNGVADDKAIYAFVGPMIQYYLNEEPIIADVGTWVLADPNQFDAVRGRMGELVVKPVDGSGGEGVMIGPDLTPAQVAAVEAEVARDPARYIAQEVVRFSTHPTLIGDQVEPRHVDLRIFALSSSLTSVTVPPVGLSRVALQSEGLLVNSSQGGGSKDTWLRG